MCFQAIAFVTALFIFVLSPLPVQADAVLDRDRQLYKDAEIALKQGKLKTYRRLRAALDHYPLAIYLDYDELRRRLSQVSLDEARRFQQAAKGSPLAGRFLTSYLMQAGRSERWQDFLTMVDEPPSRVELQCYYYRALLSEGETERAWQGAAKLWIYGKSQPEICDPLFERWMDAGQLNDELIWMRLLNAFEAREVSLMRYVARKGSPSLAPWGQWLQQVYTRPERIRQLQMPKDKARTADVVSYGLVRLARYNAARALDYWQHYQSELLFSQVQSRRVEGAIVRHLLYAESTVNLSWLETALARLQHDDLTEIRLRWALAEQDWGALDSALALLSPQARQKDVWRYWSGRVQEARGQSEAAKAAFADAAGERSYYGFLAADRLGQPYAFNEERVSLTPELAQTLATLPTVLRVQELLWHGHPWNANAEWNALLAASQETRQKSLGALAVQRNWYRMAIDAASKAKAWNALNLRFPLPYQDIFKRYAAVHKVAATQLMAIARRESAFFPDARSPVGARGLMQLMPATGQQVASQLGLAHSTAKLYDAKHNVQLGSAYYRQLLDRFGNNRIFALAGYNAGPGRVDRWRNKAGKQVPVDIWVETIPFRETRNYVQAVLAYSVVFDNQMNEVSLSLLSAAERAQNY